MNQECLSALIREQEAVLAAGSLCCVPRQAIIYLLRTLVAGEITEEQALRLLDYQATNLADEQTHAAIYRQAAADLQQMQREEHWL
jgi:hypothetical protein